MSRHTGLRVTNRSIRLYYGADGGVGVVACPYLREITENSEVESRSARGATLEKNFGVIFGERFHNRVQRNDVPIAIFADKHRFRETIAHNSVEIPLYIGGFCEFDGPFHAFDNEIFNFFVCQIEHHLKSAKIRFFPGNNHRIFGVSAEKFAVWRNHFRF